MEGASSWQLIVLIVTQALTRLFAIDWLVISKQSKKFK